MNPIIADWKNNLNTPSGESKLVMHGPAPLVIAGMQNDGTGGLKGAEKLGNLKARAGVGRRIGQRCKVVIEGNKTRVPKAIAALSNHRGRVTPKSQ